MRNVTDHLANERTFLAWIRTSIGIMAFGFVVEKFSLFIKELTTFLSKTHSHVMPTFLPNGSSILGITIVALGTFIAVLAFFNYMMITNQINNNTYQPSKKLNFLLMLSILLIGILLVLYLSISLS